MRDGVERRVDPFERLPGAQIRRVEVASTYVIHVLSRSNLLEELARARRPARHVAGDLLQHRRRALAAPVADRIGDLGARAADAWCDAVQPPIADQIPDV